VSSEGSVLVSPDSVKPPRFSPWLSELLDWEMRLVFSLGSARTDVVPVTQINSRLGNRGQSVRGSLGDTLSRATCHRVPPAASWPCSCPEGASLASPPDTWP
jgi:hypothetical protein